MDSPPRIEVIASSSVSNEEAREAFRALGSNVDTDRMAQAAKAYAWLQQTGACGIAVSDISHEKEFWYKIMQKYDPVALAEDGDGNSKWKPKDLMEYLRFRLEIGNHILTANKELTRLAAPDTTGPNKRGVKARVTPITTINPLSGRA